MRNLLLFLIVLSLFRIGGAAAQSRVGDLRLSVTDPAGLGIKASVELTSEANQYQQTYVTDDSGGVSAKRLPFGVYTIHIQGQGFAEFSGAVEIRSSLPVEFNAKLSLEPASTTVTVHDENTLLDPHRTGTVNRIGQDTIQQRVSSLPGRSIVDLVNTQPGWLYEGNAVLHPRGAEYGTQFVVDGIPLTDNRSPGFGVEIEGDDVQSLSVYTAGFPAEFGRKLSGVVEVETARDTRKGFHGKFVSSGGSYDSLGGYLLTQYAWGKNTLTASVDGAMTEHYLNPPVVQNYTNTGTNSNFALRYERDVTEKDRLSFEVRHGAAHFEVPNEQVQQAGGQRQDRGISETMGIAGYEHLFSSSVLDVRFFSRDYSTDLQSNPFSTPIMPSQQRGFREVYAKGALSIHHGRHEWKTGVETDSTHVHERFQYVITDPSQFDPGTPLSFGPFYQQKWDLEQSAFVQDQIRLGKWTASAGLRWDHYQLLANQNAVSPRLGVARYLEHANLVLHAAYDRVFQTPSFENILLSSSAEASHLNNQNFLQLPVKPSLGNFFEIGASKALFDQLRIDVNVFDRRMNNFADDDQLLNTGISFPIAFRKANLYGAEGKIEIPHWGRVNGFVSYSYIVGSVYFPVAGGLFLGQDVPPALNGVGRFWNSQDQRNTVRARFRYELTSRLWAGIGGDFGSGLPVAFDGTVQQAIAQYGEAVVSRVNIPHGRVRQNLSISASLGAQVWKSDKFDVRMQADGTDLNGRLNVIDFAGLFSGNAIEPGRSFALRLTVGF